MLDSYQECRNSDSYQDCNLRTRLNNNSQYQPERLTIMTSKTLLAGLLTTLVFLILIEFSNSNPTGIRQKDSSDESKNGVVESRLLDDEYLVREKRRASTTRKATTRGVSSTRKATTGGVSTTRKATTRGGSTTRRPSRRPSRRPPGSKTKKYKRNGTNKNNGSPVLVLVLLSMSFFSLAKRV